jgi:hypothetical protein|tara:strand:+ start:7261 stop:7440 length:180 start_codon:yes stop_codon:yes gene_type:complete
MLAKRTLLDTYWIWWNEKMLRVNHHYQNHFDNGFSILLPEVNKAMILGKHFKSAHVISW